ncbi:MAG: hypothetical protein JNK71_05720 [Methyloversatilis sp.]|nr:hypothetical protein [Methyloversatilis sp.]
MRYATRNKAGSDLLPNCAVFYNQGRRHSALVYLSSTTFSHNSIELHNRQEMAGRARQLE